MSSANPPQEPLDYWERERRKKIISNYKAKHKGFNRWTGSDNADLSSDSDVGGYGYGYDGPADHPAVGGPPIYSFVNVHKQTRSRMPSEQRKTPIDAVIEADTRNFINNRPGYRLIDSNTRDEYTEEYRY